MPPKEIEIPVAFPDRRQIIVKISPKANVLDLKRAIAKADAVEVLAAGANADLLGKRHTAPAAFRLICRGLELNNTGTLEYYHLTTKGKNQPAVKVTPKHESLIDDDEVLGEDFSVPETVAHLEEEKKLREEEEEEARLAAKRRHQTFRQTSSAMRGKKPAADGVDGSAQNSPSKRSTSRPRSGGGIASAAAVVVAATRSNANTPSVYERSNIPTPDPTNPNSFLQSNTNSNNQSAIQQQQLNVSSYKQGDFYFGATEAATGVGAARRPLHQHLPPMGDVTQYSHQQGLTFKEVVVPVSPSRGLAPMPANSHVPGTALFALPLDDSSAPMTGQVGGSGNSPDIIRQMKSYLRAAEKGDAPAPQVLPLPSSALLSGLTPLHRHHQQVRRNLAAGMGSFVSHNSSGGNGGGGGVAHVNHLSESGTDDAENDRAGCSNPNCVNVKKLQAAELRIQQLEATVERYKSLLHRLTQMEQQQDQKQQLQQQDQQPQKTKPQMRR